MTGDSPDARDGVAGREEDDSLTQLLWEVEADSDGEYGYHSTATALRLDRIAYGLFGHFYRGKDATYKHFARALRQARIPVSYDIYLSRITFYSLSAAIVGVALGLSLGVIAAPFLAQFSTNIAVPWAVGQFIAEYKLLFGVLGITFFSSLSFFAVTLGALYYWPFYIAGERKREIDAMLPHAITFMYAMARGGVNVLGVMRALAEADDSYGEVSNEFRAIINNVDYVRQDLRTAILQESNETVSKGMQAFLEDLLNVVDTGADMEQFFLNKSEVYLNRAREKQQQTLDTLELMSEAYVTVFVASPIFVLIILVVMALLGGVDIMLLYAMTYFALPVGGIMFSVIIMLISETGESGSKTLKYSKGGTIWSSLTVDVDEVKEDPRYTAYRQNRASQNLGQKVLAPFKLMRTMPSLSLVITGPLTGMWIYYLYASNLAEFSFEGFLSAPVWQTLVLFYVPVLLTGGCFTILYELKQRRESRILSRLPEAFKSASDANARGLTIKESFEIVAGNSAGSLAKQLTLAVNSTTWTGDLNSALIDFANSLQVPRLSRTIKLITKANEVSGDIQSVLTVAARDVENMANLDRERKANAFTYMAIILVSFLVSMGVIVALDAEFLSRLASNEAFSGGGGNGLGGFGGGGEIPIREFRMAFLHAVMALGGSSGLVAGSMADNDILAGFKYAIVMMGLALLVFGIF